MEGVECLLDQRQPWQTVKKRFQIGVYINEMFYKVAQQSFC